MLKIFLAALIAAISIGSANAQYLSFLGTGGGGGSSTFNPPVGKFTIATDANHWGATEQWWDGPQYCEFGSTRKLITAYLDGVSSSDTKKMRVKSVDMTDGGVTISSASFSRDFDGSATHDRPFVWIDPDDKKVWVFYGAEEAWSLSDGLYYQVSATECGVDFGGENEALASGVGVGGTLAQFPLARKTADGTMHFFVQGGASNGAYFRRSSDGTWTDVNTTFVDNSNNSTCGVPQPFGWIVDSNDDLHLAWTSSNSSGQNRGIWYVKSTDSGDNWCSVAGTNCVAASTGFTDSASTVQCSSSSSYLRTYSSNYQVQSSTTQNAAGPAIQSVSGSPVIVTGDGGTSLIALYRSGGAWTQSTIATSLSGGPRGHVLVQTDTKLVAVYIESTTSDIYYKTSTDGGATWSPSGLGTMLEDFGSESAASDDYSYRNIGCSTAQPSGQSDWYVFCAWSARFETDGTPGDTDHDEIRAEIFVP